MSPSAPFTPSVANQWRRARRAISESPHQRPGGQYQHEAHVPLRIRKRIVRSHDTHLTLITIRSYTLIVIRLRTAVWSQNSKDRVNLNCIMNCIPPIATNQGTGPFLFTMLKKHACGQPYGYACPHDHCLTSWLPLMYAACSGFGVGAPHIASAYDLSCQLEQSSLSDQRRLQYGLPRSSCPRGCVVIAIRRLAVCLEWVRALQNVWEAGLVAYDQEIFVQVSHVERTAESERPGEQRALPECFHLDKVLP